MTGGSCACRWTCRRPSQLVDCGYGDRLRTVPLTLQAALATLQRKPPEPT